MSRVLAFKEKPDLATAEAYLATGDYWWNSGMFVWRAATLLDQLRLLLPETHAWSPSSPPHPSGSPRSTRAW